MEKIHVLISVIEDDPNKATESGFIPKIHGSVKSTRDGINVNKISDKYSIVFRESDFLSIPAPALKNAIVKLFQDNLGKDIEIKFYCLYLVKNSYNDTIVRVSLDTFINDQIKESKPIMLKPEIFDEEADDLDEDEEDFEFDDDIDDSDEDEDEDEDFMGDILGMYSIYDDSDEDDYDEKPEKKHYAASRVFKRSKDPKKSIHKHGVLIASSKKTVNQDEKIIKEFLKDFLPGKSKWIKEFRKDVARRWIEMYVVTKKQLKELEKQHRKSLKRKYSAEKENIAAEITRRIFSPRDRWSDPNK